MLPFFFFVLLSHFFSILHIATSWRSSCTRLSTILLTLLRKALHHLSLYLIDTLYLVLSKELRVFLVILLTDVEILHAHLETLLYLLLGLRLRASPVAAGTRSKSPYLFLALGVSVNKLTFCLLIESQVVGNVLCLFFSQLLARDALLLSRSLS